MSEQVTLTPEAQLSLNEAAAQNDWEPKRIETVNNALLSNPELTQTGKDEEALDTGASELDESHREGLNALAAAAIAEAAAKGDWTQDKVDQVTARALADQNK